MLSQHFNLTRLSAMMLLFQTLSVEFEQLSAVLNG